jgi:hypothetical protein
MLEPTGHEYGYSEIEYALSLASSVKFRITDGGRLNSFLYDDALRLWHRAVSRVA